MAQRCQQPLAEVCTAAKSTAQATKPAALCTSGQGDHVALVAVALPPARAVGAARNFFHNLNSKENVSELSDAPLDILMPSRRSAAGMIAGWR